MTRAKTIAINFLSLVGSDFVVRLLGVFSTGLLARRIGPADFGLLNLCLVIVNYFALLATWGLPAVATREVSIDRSLVRLWTLHITKIRMGLAAIAYLLLVTCWFWPGFSDEKKVILTVYGLTLFTTVLMLEWPFQAIERMKHIGFARIAAAVVYLAGIVIFVRAPENILAVPWLLLASQATAALFLAAVLFRRAEETPSKKQLPGARALLAQAMPIGFAIVMGTLLLNVDTLLIGYLRTDAEVGFYSGAYRVVLVVTGLVSAFSNALFPSIAYYSEHQREKLTLLLRYVARIYALGLFPIAVGGFFVAEPVMHLFFGNAFSNGGQALRILLFSLWLNSANALYFYLLVSQREHSALLRVLVIQTVINVALNLLLIPRFGLVGAASATVVSDAVGYVCFRRTAKIAVPFLRPALKALPACAIMAAVLYAGRSHWLSAFILVPVGAIVYAIGLWVSRGIQKDDVAFAIKLLRGTQGNLV
jgi:O-antigen/teichoic acid export membrane protein